jgi:hypothetical protein
MVPDCLENDSVLVHTFQQHHMKFTENSSESSLKKKVLSSGSASKYKNRKKFTKHYLPQ